MSFYGFTIQDLVKQDRVNAKDIEYLKQWAKTQDLPRYPDETLALFYMACQSNIENTKKCAIAYYKSRVEAPELFNDRDITRADIQHQLQVLNFCVLPQRTDEGYVIMFHRLVDFEASQYHMEVAMKVYFMTTETAIYDDPPTGIISLFDMRGVGLRHLTRIKLGAVKKFLNYVQEGLPLRLVSIHILNVVWFFDKIFKLIKPFIKPEVLEFLFLHTTGINMEEFYEKYIPKKCLPRDYGGDLDSADELQTLTIEKITALQDFFQKEQEMRTV